ncbi:MAG TPA: hypothetical protein VGQ73_00520 [Gemmatimonadales bacterium]|nr:hypothetical protein [Gemmatimonadales bacterium]
MRPTRALRSLLMLAPLVLPYQAARAQRYWHDEQGRDAFRLDLGKPFLKGDGHSFFTGTAVPSMSLRAADGIRVEADFPLMRAGFEFGGTIGDQSSVRVGNPYVGLRVGEDAKLISGTLGFRLPLAAKPDTPIGQQALTAGALTTFDEFEAFAANFLTVRGALEAHKVSANHILLGAKAGPSVLITTNGNPNAQTDVFFDFGGRVGYEGSGSQLSVGLSGRYLVTPADKAFLFCSNVNVNCEVKRAHYAATGAAELRWGSIRPRVTIRIPFNKDTRNQVGAILGLGVSVAR